MFSLALDFPVAVPPLQPNGYALALFVGRRAPSMAKMGISVAYLAIRGRELSPPALFSSMETDRQNVFVLLRMPPPLSVARSEKLSTLPLFGRLACRSFPAGLLHAFRTSSSRVPVPAARPIHGPSLQVATLVSPFAEALLVDPSLGWSPSAPSSLVCMH